MPLVRVQVRNEYGLGMPELYGETNREDPKAVLDGVAVSGLVGLLRQLGDLAEFAAEVFHVLQEQMVTTASRSHKLMVRVQHIEAALPPLEKTILTQKSHLHFAYTAGSRWHTCIQNEQNHFIYDDLPRFIMDSYEECLDPPRLHLLDKFDTGGPGSCSKRYSDPTFFKEASVSPDEANSVKVPRDKKVQRSKKKRIRQRNREVSHGASVSSHSGRMQFTSLNIDDQQTSWTVSTFDDTLKSDLREQPNSFDSRIGSGDIECIFHPSYCVESGEYVGTKESSPCIAKMQHNDSLDSAFVDKQSIIIDDGLPQSLTQEQIGPSSSFVTWDEKTEIVELTNQQYDSDEIPEKLPAVFDVDTQERRTVISESVGQMDYHSDNEKTPKSLSGGNHKINDIESETDNYMDALNSIGSESEIDLDCQIKQEVPEYSNLSGQTEDGLLGLRAHQSDHHPLNFESQTATSSSLNKGASWENPNLGSSESYAQEQSPQMDGSSSNLSKMPGTDFCGNADILDGSSIEPVISNISSYSVEPNTDARMSDELISSSCESRKSPTEPSGPRSVKLWTNGGLLGLEPSKPPDCSTMNSASQDPVTTNEDYKIGSSNQSNILRGNEHAGDDASSQPKIVKGNGYAAAKLGTLMTCSDSIEYDLSSKCSTSYRDDQQDNISTKSISRKFSQADLGVKLEKSGDLHCTSGFSHAHGYGFNGTGVSTADPEQPGTPDITSLFNEASQEDGNNSSHMFGIGHGLLVNGFQRNVSHIQVEDFEPTSFVKTDISEQKSSNRCVVYQTSSGTHFNKHFGERHPVNSPSSSPPIEHMKISFQPINGFETSKLTLKFLDHDHRHESSKDTFPSFQLVPEPLISLHDDGSDFDDDISYRSSPYMSDDCLSLHSESNPGQWESAKTLGNNDQNTSYKITPMESVLSSLDLGRTALGSFGFDCELKSPYAENVVEPSPSDHLLDLPSFDVAGPVFKQEMKNNFDAKDLPDLCLPNEPSPPPPPPPLPPLQWRAVKSLSDVAEDKKFTESDACNHVFDMKILQPTVTLQNKPSPVKQQKNSEEDIACALRIKENEQQKLNRQRKANQLTIDNGKAEGEDFLNQIRTKSFSLRRTVTRRQASAPTPEPINNAKVTAILEKANAIRQAVGSDNGGDDDNWSDT